MLVNESIILLALIIAAVGGGCPDSFLHSVCSHYSTFQQLPLCLALTAPSRRRHTVSAISWLGKGRSRCSHQQQHLLKRLSLRLPSSRVLCLPLCRLCLKCRSPQHLP